MKTKYLSGKFIEILTRTYKRYTYDEDFVVRIFKNSQIYKRTVIFLKFLKMCFRYTYLDKITSVKEPGESYDSAILNNNRTAQGTANLFKKLYKKARQFFIFSIIFSLLRELKVGLFQYPVKSVSIVILTAILTDALLLVFIHREIIAYSVAVASTLILISVSGLFSKADWQEIKRTSLFLKIFQVIVAKL